MRFYWSHDIHDNKKWTRWLTVCSTTKGTRLCAWGSWLQSENKLLTAPNWTPMPWLLVQLLWSCLSRALSDSWWTLVDSLDVDWMNEFRTVREDICAMSRKDDKGSMMFVDAKVDAACSRVPDGLLACRLRAVRPADCFTYIKRRHNRMFSFFSFFLHSIELASTSQHITANNVKIATFT